ncbi:MAG: FAD-binding protein, partial [Promethearchaeota archaeon]
QFLIRPKLRGTNLIGGQAIVNALLNETKKRNIEIYNKIFITDLLKSKNNSRIGGAIGFNRINGEFHIFQAKAVVLAASNNSFRGNYACTQATTGSSYKLAYEIGAILRNMEFIYINTGSPIFGFEGTGPICQMGAQFKNKNNEAFMVKYDPRLKDKTDAGIISKSMALEVKNGRGPPLYLDFSKVGKSLQIVSNFMGGWMPLHIKRLKKLDSAHFSQQQEWIPTMQIMLGGVYTNFDCESTVPGLFAAGDCHSAGGLGGFNGMASAHCAWSGTHAGIGAAKYIKNADNTTLDYDQINLLKKSLYKPLDRDQGKTPEEILLKMQAIIFPYDVMIIRHKERLENALRKISKLRQDTMLADDFHNLTKLKEVENMLLCAELFLKASIMRKESRKDYYRQDYPNVDNKNWLKWILVKKNKEKNQSDFYTEPLIWEDPSIIK